jgi:hypothetical protein
MCYGYGGKDKMMFDSFAKVICFYAIIIGLIAFVLGAWVF